MPVEIGVFTFADTREGEVGAEQRLRDLMEEIELADEVGPDVFGVGEHHRPDFAVSTPALVLAAAAALAGLAVHWRTVETRATMGEPCLR